MILRAPRYTRTDTLFPDTPLSRSPGEDQAYEIIPAPSNQTAPSEYRIGPLDVLKITVFQEPDLSLEEVPVDASGNILFPLIGQVSVSGKTSTELSNAIAQRLGERYLVDPQVSTIEIGRASCRERVGQER